MIRAIKIHGLLNCSVVLLMYTLLNVSIGDKQGRTFRCMFSIRLQPTDVDLSSI